MTRLTTLSEVREAERIEAIEKARIKENMMNKATGACKEYIASVVPALEELLEEIKKAYELEWVTIQSFNRASYDTYADEAASQCSVSIRGGLKHIEKGFFPWSKSKTTFLEWLELVIEPYPQGLFLCVTQELALYYSDQYQRPRLTNAQIRELAQMIADSTSRNVTYCAPSYRCSRGGNNTTFSSGFNDRVIPQLHENADVLDS